MIMERAGYQRSVDPKFQFRSVGLGGFMKVRFFGVALALVCLATFVLQTGQSLTNSAVSVTRLKQKASVLERYGKLPRIFEINQGQTDKEVKFLSRGSGYTLFLAQREAVLAFRSPAGVRSPSLPCRR